MASLFGLTIRLIGSFKQEEDSGFRENGVVNSTKCRSRLDRGSFVETYFHFALPKIPALRFAPAGMTNYYGDIHDQNHNRLPRRSHCFSDG